MMPTGLHSRPLSRLSPLTALLAMTIGTTVAVLLVGSGCAAQQGTTRGTTYGSPSRDVAPEVLAVTATNFFDTDDNRYRDTSSVIIYLFAGESPLPMTAEGSFSFTLEGVESRRRLAAWHFDQQQTAGSIVEGGPGPGYRFELSIFDADEGPRTDRIDERQGELLVTFTPSGEDVRPLRRRSSMLEIGPVGRGGLH